MVFGSVVWYRLHNIYHKYLIQSKFSFKYSPISCLGIFSFFCFVQGTSCRFYLSLSLFFYIKVRCACWMKMSSTLWILSLIFSNLIAEGCFVFLFCQYIVTMKWFSSVVILIKTICSSIKSEQFWYVPIYDFFGVIPISCISFFRFSVKIGIIFRFISNLMTKMTIFRLSTLIQYWFNQQYENQLKYF